MRERSSSGGTVHLTYMGYDEVGAPAVEYEHEPPPGWSSPIRTSVEADDHRVEGAEQA